MAERLNIAVGIATAGRAGVLIETLREIGMQHRAADAFFVCGTKSADLDGIAEEFPNVDRLLPTKTGLTRQRNAIIEAAYDMDVLVFFDDDFMPEPGYLAAIEQAMTADQTIVVATGTVLGDGIIGPGLTPDDARQILSRPARYDNEAIRSVFTGYGCNMAVRLDPMRRHAVNFDARLPLYGWQEDVDLSRRMASFGRVVQVTAARGVHLGAKSGRASGVRLGYSQVANPLYLSGKRHGYPFGRALSHIAKNVGMNVARSFRPESYVDRRGRLRGNLIALVDLVRGKMVPERILDL